MIDLHSHILPCVDDGSTNMSMSIEMAKIAISDGTTVMACTPHFMPGVYETTYEQMVSAVGQLQQCLADVGLGLRLVTGGDLHVSPDMPDKLASRQLPTLGNTRYFLFEPPHHILPPNLLKFGQRLMRKGFVPILTHPERLTWIEKHYDVICEMDEIGIPIQLTARSVTGEFGRRPKYWSDRMLEEGRVDIIASDAHNITSRPPGLSKARDFVLERFGQETAARIFETNPYVILNNQALVPKMPRTTNNNGKYKRKSWRSIFGLKGS